MVFRVLGASLALLVPVAVAAASELGDVTTLTPARADGSTTFTVTGGAPVLVVIRGLGPSLVDQGALTQREAIGDPKLTLSLDGTTVASNDDWRDHPNAGLIPAALQPAYDVESALALTLAPGTYVATVQSKTRHGRRRLGAVSVAKAETAGTTRACANVTPICASVSHDADSATCELSQEVCAVDLELLIAELTSQDIAVTTSTPMSITAIGGAGGRSADDGAGGGGAGEAQTDTTAADIATKLGTMQLYYFIGRKGADGNSTCGGAGGSATIVTTEDLSLNPDQEPEIDDLLLVAAGGGGGGGQNEEGFCSGGGQSQGGAGGGVIASSGTDVRERGFPATNCAADQGGSRSTDDGKGCVLHGVDGDPDAGVSEPGGLGGAGGSGSSCQTSGKPTPFLNAGSLTLALGGAGEGGRGGTGTDACDSGGGGGGGGYGGGGGGGHGNDIGSSAGGGGGGSFARGLTPASSTPGAAPQAIAGCSDSGCVIVQFDLSE
jgi:hypothetical protein